MLKKILLASDGSDNALRAAAFTAGLLGQIPAARLTVLVVNDMLDKMKFYSPLRSPVIFEEIDLFFREKTQDALTRTMALFNEEKHRVNSDVKVGNPAEEILDYAKSGGYDLIIIGSRGLGSIKGLILGSVSTKVLQLADCPVTVIK